MSETNPTLTALFTDIADAIREKTGDTASIIADDFPDVIRERLQVIPPREACLTFSSPSSFTLKVNDATKHWDGTLEYSTDKRSWTVWDGTTTLSSASSGSVNVLYLSGIGNTVITGSQPDYGWVMTGTDIKCIGNIENLLDYATVESGNHPTMAKYCYQGMFYGCTSLTQAPVLPSTTTAPNCYQGMFYGCTSLTQAPALPATTLASGCYRLMFRGCTSLTTATALPATALANQCYEGMFYNCPNLTTAPALPATTLADYCYYNMFNGCTSLKLSTTQTDEYTQDYCIPSYGTGTNGRDSLYHMFFSTGGTFTGTPSINTIYYLSNTNQVIYPSVTLISFTIAGESYQAEEGMTWEQWVNSDYNTIGATIQNNLVVDSNGRYALDTVTSGSQTINAYEAYSWGPYMPFPGP